MAVKEKSQSQLKEINLCSRYQKLACNCCNRFFFFGNVLNDIKADTVSLTVSFSDKAIAQVETKHIVDFAPPVEEVERL